MLTGTISQEYIDAAKKAHACDDALEWLAKPHTYKELRRPEQVCDARCMGSRGPNCDCSCGGANHGKSWEA